MEKKEEYNQKREFIEKQLKKIYDLRASIGRYAKKKEERRLGYKTETETEAEARPPKEESRGYRD